MLSTSKAEVIVITSSITLSKDIISSKVTINVDEPISCYDRFIKLFALCFICSFGELKCLRKM